MQTVSHDGRKTAYRETHPEEDGPTAVYVHGSGGNHQLWVHQYAPSGPTHPAVAVDLSGHGESEDIGLEAGQATLREYANDVAAVARATETDVLVGNSLGGAVVFEVLQSGLFDPAGAVFAGSGAKLAVAERLRTALNSDFEDAIEQLHEPGMLFADAEETLLEQSISAMRETGRDVTRRDFLTCHAFDIREKVATISTPSLAVVGEEDRLTPPSYHQYLSEHMEACTYRSIPDAGHLVMLERPETFNEVLASFFEDFAR